MANELRKTLGRNMRFAQINEDIDNQIRQLQARNSYDVNAQMQINALEQQKALNEQQMQQPMSAAEYAEYDDNGRYIGTGMPTQVQPQSNNDFKQMALDGMNHFAQGASLGWSDEAYGVAHGVYDMGRTWYNGNPDNEEYGDIYNRSYVKHRDAVRQELEDGYQRNPVISGLAEIGGALVSPIKIHTPRGYIGSLGNKISTSADIAKSRFINSVGTGVINGIGSTDENTFDNYAKNIGMSVGTNYLGTRLGDKIYGGGNEMYRIGRVVMNGATNSVPYTYNLYQRRKDER